MALSVVRGFGLKQGPCRSFYITAATDDNQLPGPQWLYCIALIFGTIRGDPAGGAFQHRAAAEMMTGRL
jgi:hypothetical protein